MGGQCLTRPPNDIGTQAYSWPGQGRADTVDKIIVDAQNGLCAIYTSMVTLAEVTKPRRGPIQVGQEIEEMNVCSRDDA